MKNLFTTYFILLACLFFYLNQPVRVLGAPPPEGAKQLLEQTGQEVFEETPSKLEPFAATVINAGLTVVGTLFLLMTIYGGFLWMEARGDESKAKKARDIIVMAAIGITVVMGSYALAAFIFKRLENI